MCITRHYLFLFLFHSLCALPFEHSSSVICTDLMCSHYTLICIKIVLYGEGSWQSQGICWHETEHDQARIVKLVILMHV